MQASRSVHMIGLGIRSAEMLASSAFLTSSASTFSLQNDILTGLIQSFKGAYTSDATVSWKNLSNSDIPSEPAIRFQKVWDKVVATSVYNDILSRWTGVTKQARHKAAKAPRARDFMNAPSIASVGLRHSNEEIRVTVKYDLALPSANPINACAVLKLTQGAFMAYCAERAHLCLSPQPVVQKEHTSACQHSLWCRKSKPRHVTTACGAERAHLGMSPQHVVQKEHTSACHHSMWCRKSTPRHVTTACGAERAHLSMSPQPVVQKERTSACHHSLWCRKSESRHVTTACGAERRTSACHHSLWCRKSAPRHVTTACGAERAHLGMSPQPVV